MATKLIEGRVNLDRLGLIKLPEWLADVEVTGGFFCFNNLLQTLQGAPRIVRGDFYCHNNLQTLEGAPREVKGDFFCNNNAVKFTEEYVRSVCNVKGRVFL